MVLSSLGRKRKMCAISGAAGATVVAHLPTMSIKATMSRPIGDFHCHT